MKCKDCGNTSPALPGFPKHVFCNHYYLHMSNIADADRCEYFEQKPQTNYDRIVSKTPEELADWIAEILTYHGGLYRRMFSDLPWECDADCPLYKCCNDQPSDNIEDWLRQEAEE